MCSSDLFEISGDATDFDSVRHLFKVFPLLRQVQVNGRDLPLHAVKFHNFPLSENVVKAIDERVGRAAVAGIGACIRRRGRISAAAATVCGRRRAAVRRRRRICVGERFEEWLAVLPAHVAVPARVVAHADAPETWPVLSCNATAADASSVEIGRAHV